MDACLHRAYRQHLVAIDLGKSAVVFPPARLTRHPLGVFATRLGELTCNSSRE